MMSKDMEKRAEARAREIARAAGMPESMWELFLVDAYSALTNEPQAAPAARPAQGSKDREGLREAVAEIIRRWSWEDDFEDGNEYKVADLILDLLPGVADGGPAAAPG